MVVDTSALLAVLFGEDEAEDLAAAMAAASRLLISALAMASGEPLLFKGEDFSMTDVPRP
jgi:uncharacterized protein with PIN domain